AWHRSLEARADDFASALLMPFESITARFDARVRDKRVALADLAQLAVEFGVSTQALVIRLHAVNRIRKPAKEELLNSTTLRDLARSLRPEPEPRDEGPFPPRFEQLARTAYLRRE